MRLLIDEPGAQGFRYMTTRQVGGETRSYFAARDKRAIIVIRIPRFQGFNTDLPRLVGKVVDVALGWDERGERGLVLKQNVGKRHSKATIFRVLKERDYDQTLSQFLDDAPKFKQEGGETG